MSEAILRTGLLGADDSPREVEGAEAAAQAAEVVSRGEPSGTRVQIPGAVCFHSTGSIGSMIGDYAPGAAGAPWGVYPMGSFSRSELAG